MGGWFKTVSQHTFTTLKFSVITTALYENKKIQQWTKTRYIMHWLPEFLYMKAKFGPLEKRIKNETSIEIKFFRRKAWYMLLTTKGMTIIICFKLNY
jgi:hypothetical protein